jgi:RIP metalloprotease RseP
MNFVLAVAFFAWLNHAYGIIGRIGIGPAPEMRVAAVRPDSPADRAGVVPGSHWIAVNGVPLSNWENLGAQLKNDRRPPTLGLTTPRGDTIRITAAPGLANLDALGAEWEALPVVGTLVPLEPASEAGIKEGDRLIAVDGKPVSTWNQMSEIIRRHAGKEVGIEIGRNGYRQTIFVKPAIDIASDGPDDGVRLGIVDAIGTAFAQTWVVTEKLVRFLERLITGALSPKYLSGPIGIFKMTGAAAAQGAATYIGFLALLSAQLGFFNLIPIALLDGGHLLFLAFEGITGKRPSARQQGVIQQVGVVLLLGLMIMVTIIDLGRFF